MPKCPRMDPHRLRPAVMDDPRHPSPAKALYVVQAEQEPLGGMIQAVHGRLNGGQLVGVYASLQGGFPLEGEVSFEVGFGHGRESFLKIFPFGANGTPGKVFVTKLHIVLTM